MRIFRRWRKLVLIPLLLLLIAAKGPAGCANVKGAPESGWLGCHKLEKLFIYAGGSQVSKQIMAAIAMAEGGGAAPDGTWKSNQYAHLDDSDGTNDEGYWGINSINEGTYYPEGANRYDPLVNARAAVAILNGVGLTAWATYNSGKYHGFCGE